MRRVAWIALMLTLAVLFPAVGRAEGPAVSMEAAAGFDGRAKSGAWVPVMLTLKNDGAEFSGEIQFETRLDYGPMRNVGDYRTPVTVPAGAVKRVPLLVPTAMMGFPAIRLMQGDTEVAKVQPTVEVGRDILLGVLGVEPSELAALGGLKVGDRNVRLVRLTPESIPSDAMALESLDAVLLDRFAYSELPEPQRLAVQGWVEHGGTLIAAAGSEGRRLEGLAPWAPLSLQGAAEATIPGVGKAPLMKADLKDWEVTWSEGGQALTAKYRKGAGAIYYLAFDPALEPFASWKGLPGAFGAMLPSTDYSADMMQFSGGAPLQNLGNALGQQPIREIPSTKRLLILLGIYALVIGPAHLIALRAFRRLGWALLTLPVLAVAGGAGGWFFIRKVAASEVIVTSLTVMEGQPGGSSLRTRSVAGLTMPPGSRGVFSLGGALLSPVPVPINAPMDPSKTLEVKATVAQGRQAKLEPQESWATRAVGAEAIVGEGGSVTGKLMVNGVETKGRLTSGLSFPLKDAVLVINGSAASLGDLKPGDSVDVSTAMQVVRTARFVKGGFMGPQMVSEAVAQHLQPGAWGPEGPTSEQYAIMRRQQLAWSGLSSVEWLMSSSQPPAVLVGWTDHQPLPVTVGGQTVTGDSMGLYVQPVEIAFPDGDFEIPAGFLSPRLVSSEGGVQGAPQLMPGWFPPKDATSTFEFGLPAGIGARVTQMELSVPMLRTEIKRYPFVFSVYNWSSGAWQQVSTEDGTVKMADVRGLVSPDGRVRARLRGTENDHFPLGTPTLTVSGKGAQ